MESIHIFYNELEIDENNVFTANILQETEVENVLFKKKKEHAITAMAIKPYVVDSDIVKVINKKNLEV